MTDRATTATHIDDVPAPGVPGFGAAGALLVALSIFFWLTGAFNPTQVPDYASSPRQIIGMALMLILVPSYLVAAAWLSQRRSLVLVEEIRDRLPEPGAADLATDAIRGAMQRTWVRGLIIGFVLGLLNTQPLDALDSKVPILEGAISLGQLIMWSVIGVLIGVRGTAARAFRRLAEIVRLDLLRPDLLKPIARSGVVDVALVAGALLLTPLQSLDAEFRWYNYTFGLAVALPAAVFFLIWPLQPLHRRNREDREARLSALEQQLRALGPETPATAEESARLEALLAHRSRLRNARTWPLSTGMLSRVLLYLVIPPLAWVGAAVVERAVDTLLGS